MNDEELYKANKASYLTDWKDLLALMLGWSEERVLAWARQYEDGLDGRDGGMFYNDAPVHYIAPLLVPPGIRQNLNGLQELQLCWRIQEAIENGNSFCLCDPNHDWEAAKDRVEKILNEYGHSLADARD